MSAGWSKGKGTQPDTEGSGSESQLVLKLFLLELFA